MGGDEFCALFEPATRSRDPIVVGAAAALSEHGEGFYDRLLLRRDRAAARGARRRRGAADRRPAHVRAEARGPHVGGAPEQGRAAARADRARPGARHAPRRASPSSPRRPPRRLGLATDEVEKRPPRRPSCTTSARSRSRTRSSTSRARSTDDEWEFIRRHTVIGERIIAAAPALGGVARARALQPRALGRHRLPGRPVRARRSRSARASSAVADAFDAMTSDAPVLRRRARRRGGARRAAALRRHAVRPGSWSRRSARCARATTRRRRDSPPL